MDIDHSRGLIHFRGQLNLAETEVVAPKSKAAIRSTKLLPRLERMLGHSSRMSACWSSENDFGFATPSRKPRSYRGLRRALATASKEACLGHVRAHDLRHSATSILLQYGDLATVSRAVGHANPNVTATVYAHALGTPEEQAERVAAAAAAGGLGH
jgi:integrase